MQEVESQEPSPPRAALYVDGFNLYHPIKESGLKHLKWSCLWRLGEMLCAPDCFQLVKVVFCTAVPKHLPASFARHQTFNAAQIARGVLVLKGHFVPDNVGHSEKQSDINVALSVMMDGIDDVYDVAYLLSADSDQVATAKFFKHHLASQGKQLFAAIPFGKTYPTDYSSLGVVRRDVSIAMLEHCVMPEQVQGKKGMINRPVEYAPPLGWLHPDVRPKGKPPKPPKKGAWSKAFTA